MHLVAEQGAVIGIGVEIQVAPRKPELLLERSEDVMPVVDKRVVAGPYPLHDFLAGSFPCEWTAISRPPAPSARASGAITRLTLKSSEERAR
jgi:hypothetical protein